MQFCYQTLDKEILFDILPFLAYTYLLDNVKTSDKAAVLHKFDSVVTRFPSNFLKAFPKNLGMQPINK